MNNNMMVKIYFDCAKSHMYATAPLRLFNIRDRSITLKLKNVASYDTSAGVAKIRTM